MSDREPSRFLLRTAAQLFSLPDDQERFVTAYLEPEAGFQALLWRNARPSPPPFTAIKPLPWQPGFVDRIERAQLPGANPLHNEGGYYILDFSSIFEGSIMQSIPEARFIVDLCASPGGKSIFASTLFSPQRLICNEVIKKRHGALHSNLVRCRIANYEVRESDVSRLAEEFAGEADLAIVDAPCSGQSLPLKGIEAPNCYHPVNVKKCAMRQRRIIANAAEVVRPGGFLAYMTCTFSPEENEAVLAWFLKRFPEFVAVDYPAFDSHRSHLAPFPCYRLWPYDGLGAGGFTALLRRKV